MFNRDLFFELCEKYDVELSSRYGKAMMRTGETVREITDEDVRNIVPKFQQYFLYDMSIDIEKNIETAFYNLDEFLIAC